MLSRIIGGIGRTLITAGVLILLFVAYQLWGTNLQQAKAQKALASEFSQTLSTGTTTSSTSTTVPDGGLVPITAVPADLPLPAYGEAIAKLQIPKIGLRTTVVEGVGLDQLKRAPGHYQETPLPGQKGNAAIAGHRTTYGAPFHNVDKLANGDRITVQTLQGTFVYEIDSITIVRPDAVEVLADKGDNRLTLTACHPKYSARERIIVSAVLKGTPAPPIDGQEEARKQASDDAGEAGLKIDGALSGIHKSRTPAVVWGVVCALIWLATWLVARLVRRRIGRRRRNGWVLTWSPYLVGLPVFLVALYVFFENFAVLLPANY